MHVILLVCKLPQIPNFDSILIFDFFSSIQLLISMNYFHESKFYLACSLHQCCTSCGSARVRVRVGLVIRIYGKSFGHRNRFRVCCSDNLRKVRMLDWLNRRYFRYDLRSQNALNLFICVYFIFHLLQFHLFHFIYIMVEYQLVQLQVVLVAYG